jgi:hypothetical protein
LFSTICEILHLDLLQIKSDLFLIELLELTVQLGRFFIKVELKMRRTSFFPCHILAFLANYAV